MRFFITIIWQLLVLDGWVVVSQSPNRSDLPPQKRNGVTYLRASATRNASMIFGVVLSVGQLPTSFNMPNLSTRRNAILF